MGVALSICLTGVWTRAAHTSLPTIQYALNYCYTLSRNVYEEMYQLIHSVSFMNIVWQSIFSYIIIMQRGGTHCYSSTGANCLVGTGLVWVTPAPSNMVVRCRVGCNHSHCTTPHHTTCAGLSDTTAQHPALGCCCLHWCLNHDIAKSSTLSIWHVID